MFLKFANYNLEVYDCCIDIDELLALIVFKNGGKKPKFYWKYRIDLAVYAEIIERNTEVPDEEDLCLEPLGSISWKQI